MLSQMLERIVSSSLVYAGIARGMVFVALAIIVWAIFDRLARSAVGAIRKQCPGCGYSLVGLPVRSGTLRCPECGDQFDERHTELRKRLQWAPRWRVLCLGMLMLVGMSVSWWWFARPTPAPPSVVPQTQAKHTLTNGGGTQSSWHGYLGGP